MNISYEGIGYLAVTMPYGECPVGHVCTIIEEGMVMPCNSGDMFCGVVEAAEYYTTSVQLEGFVKLHYSGADPNWGWNKLAADGSGGVAVNSTGRMYLVVSVDTENKSIVMKL